MYTQPYINLEVGHKNVPDDVQVLPVTSRTGDKSYLNSYTTARFTQKLKTKNCLFYIAKARSMCN